jgi:carbamoyl-phosphate synthase large subunit
MLDRAIQKAVHSIEGENVGLYLPELATKTTEQLKELIAARDDRRFFAILELFRRGETMETIYELTKIDPFFLQSFYQLILLEQKAKETSFADIDETTFRLLKEKGFSDSFLADVWNVSELAVREKRKQLGIIPSYKMVDTCAAEFHSETDYYYSTYFGEDERKESDREKVLIIGAGPIRIGQGIEFDYSSVHSVYALQEEGYETVLINNNPETVSTDFAVADRLYFEPLTLEEVLNVIEAEQIKKVIVQFGGQTAINLVKGLEEANVTILGVSHDVIDQLEDRDRFYQLLEELDIPHVPGLMANDKNELIVNAKAVGYPVLLRPSYVIGGKGMFIVNDEQQLQQLVQEGLTFTYPVLIDAYLDGKEAEVDVVADGETILLPTIIEHVEKAGVHSGDSYALLPAQSLTEEEKAQIVAFAEKIVRQLQFKGIMNIQYVIANGKVYVLEVNPRASRTVPIVSKTTGVPLAQIATKLLLGKCLSDIVDEKHRGLANVPYIVLKYPVFSTHKLPNVDPLVGPEMKSTGEGISIAETVAEAATKAFHSYLSKKDGAHEIYVDIDIENKESSVQSLLKLIKAKHLTIVTNAPFAEWIKRKEALAFFNLKKDNESAKQRILALSQQILTFTEIETCQLFLQAIGVNDFSVSSIQDWLKKKKQTEKAVIV